MVREWKMSSLNGFMKDTPDFAYSTTFDNNSVNNYESLIRFVIQVPFKYSWEVIAEEYLKLYEICKE